MRPQAAQTRPEDAALAAQDRLIAKEFLAELDPLERQVFALSAEGLRYRAIATALRISANTARTVARSCERKRARFQLLYETGRLCGFRAATVATLEAQQGSPSAAELAKAHLSACPSCRTASPATAGAAGRRAAGAGVLVGVLSVGWGWLRRTVGAGGVSAKATAAVIAAAVVAGGTVGANDAPNAHRNVRPQTGHVTRAMPEPSKTGSPMRRGDRLGPAKPERQREAESRRARSSVQAIRGAAPARPQRVVSPDELAVQVNRAQREFGLEQ